MGGFMSAQKNAQGTYDPSPLTLRFGTSAKTKYAKQDFKATYAGSKPILVVCTDEGNMEMKNGKVFSTGNHPVEMLVPMLHFQDAGFTFDVVTNSGKPVVFEMWAFPDKDDNVKKLHADIKAMLDAPKSLADITSLNPYAAVFIPGGHGAMINLPKSAALGNLLRMAHTAGMPTVTLCHGPAALLSSGVEGEFAYTGYKMCCFTDKTDAFTPKLGYLPGEMPWKCQAALEEQGATVINKKETGQCTVDRELITGDSPDAAQNLGKLASPILVEHANKQL